MIAKRILDLVFAMLLLTLLAPAILGLCVVLLLVQGRPVFYLSRRMRNPTQEFNLVKFRTMAAAPGDSGVTGGDKVNRITPCGHWLRRTRLDEVPQLWNILRGDMSFVGPRPPLPSYVRAFPAVYGNTLSVKPGVTSLASLAFKDREQVFLGPCHTAEDTHRTYVSKCLHQKARLDRYYIQNQTLRLDFLIAFQTIGDLCRRA